MENNLEKFELLKTELESKIECVENMNFFSGFSAKFMVDELMKNKKGDFKGKFVGSEYTQADFIKHIGLNKKVIIEFCMAHPEVAYNILYWPIVFGIIKKSDFAGYTKEQLVKIPRIDREIIVHPENVYKLKVLHKIDERIFYFIPNEGYWEALEWIATYAPDKLKTIITKTSALNPFGRKNVVAHYKGVKDKSTIPEAIREFLDGSSKLHDLQVENGKNTVEIQRQRNLEKKLSWVDENGNLLKLFELSDGVEITSVDDYMLIANYFVNSDLSVSDFCRKYQIDDVQGFKKMCEKIALVDSEFAEFYKANLEKKSTAFVSIIKHQIEDIADGKLEIPEMLTSQSQMKSLKTVMEIGLSTVSNEHIYRFSEKIIDYYYDRIYSYDSNSTNPNEISKRLTEAEVKFLMPSNIVKKRKSGANINLGDEFAKPFVIIINQINPASKDKIYNKTKGLYRKLNAYAEDYDGNAYVSGELQFIIDGEIKRVSQEMVDMAEAYASKYNLFKSAGTMSRVVKAVAEGKIQNQAETEEYKQKLQANILKKMKECKTLAEYFEKYQSLS